MKKNNRTILLGIIFILLTLVAVFAIDYFQTKSLLKNGIKAKAQITGKYYEISTDKRDTSSYSFRMVVLPDTANVKQIYKTPERLQAFVKQKSFYKYSEGNVVNVVYDKEDVDHAKLVEEIE